MTPQPDPRCPWWWYLLLFVVVELLTWAACTAAGAM